MSRVVAFSLVENSGVAQVLRRRVVALSLEAIARDRVVSVDRLMAGRWRTNGSESRETYRTWSEREIPVGRHAVSGVNHDRPFGGLILSSSVPALLYMLERRYLPIPGTDLRRWLGGRPFDRDAACLLGLAFERRCLLSLPPAAESLIPKLPRGMLVATDPDPLGLQPIGDGETWYQRAGNAAIAVVAPDRMELAGTWLTRSVFAVLPDGHGAIAWFDGRSFGYAAEIGGIPPALRRRLESQGTAVLAHPNLTRPRVDQRPHLLLRVPGTREVRGRSGRPGPVPTTAARPAILEPLSAAIALTDAEGRRLPIPTITDPSEALAVLARTTGGRIYVPHAHPVDVADVELPARSEWRIGCLPASVSS